MRITIGTNLAGYRIEREVARGGMGIVYRATELALDRPVALKLIAPDLADVPSFRERFLRESRLAASIDHPSILPVYAAGEADGRLYLVTRYVEGTDLRALLAPGETLSPARALAFAGQIASALDAAHRRGLVHHDVKPGNILVADDHCYLCDFGLTRELGVATTGTAGLLAGSLDYLAPEQIRREHVDGSVDQYALACVLYECLTGSPPFRRGSSAETLWAHMQEQPARLVAYPELDSVFARALAKDPAERYPTCSGLVDEARTALGLGPAPEMVRRRRLRVGRGLVVGGAALLAALAAAVIASLVLGGGGGAAVSPNSVAALDPGSGEVVATIPLLRAFVTAASNDSVWAEFTSEEGRQALARIDTASRAVASTFTVSGDPVDMLPAAGSLWVSTRQGHVFRIDPASGDVTGDWTLPNAAKALPDVVQGVGSLAYGEGKIWAASFRAISSIDPSTSELTAKRSPMWGPLAFGFGSLWVFQATWPDERGYPPSELHRLDPTTLTREARMFVPTSDFEPRAAVFGSTSAWAIGGGRLYEIDPKTNRPGRIHEIEDRCSGIAAAAGAVWVTSYAAAAVRIDEETGETKRIDLDGIPVGIAAGGGLVWVSVRDPDG